jgi:hypothetical protein
MSDETRGDMADQAEISIMAAERAAIDAVRAARRQRLAEGPDDQSESGSGHQAEPRHPDAGTASR